MIILAIDPGVRGSISVRYPTLESVRNPDTFSKSVRNPDSLVKSFTMAENDPLTVLREFQGVKCVAYLEKVGGYIPNEKGDGQPGSRMFTFGQSYGYLRGVLDAFGIQTRLIIPQVWQRGIPGRKGKYSERKKALKLHAARLFPLMEVCADSADALCLLHYAAFQELGVNAGFQSAKKQLPTLPPMHEQFVHAEGWAKRNGWPIPPKGSTLRSEMVDCWANAFLNGDA